MQNRRRRLPSRVDSSPKNHRDPCATTESRLYGWNPSRRSADVQRPLDAEKNQQVGTCSPVELRPVTAGDSRARVRRPLALPERVETEPADEISAALETVPAGTQSPDEAGPDVDAGGHCDPERCFDAAGTGEDTIDPSLDLQRLLRAEKQPD